MSYLSKDFVYTPMTSLLNYPWPSSKLDLYLHGIGLPFSLLRRCLLPGFHQSLLLSSFYLPCDICPAPACGAYLQVFTNAFNLIAITKVSVDGFPAWFRMFLLFCLMNPINFFFLSTRNVANKMPRPSTSLEEIGPYQAICFSGGRFQWN